MVEEQNSLILNDLVEHLWSVKELSTEQAGEGGRLGGHHQAGQLTGRNETDRLH